MIEMLLLSAMTAKAEIGPLQEIRSNPIHFLGKRIKICGKIGSPLPENYIWDINEFEATVAAKFRLDHSGKKLSVGGEKRVCMTGLLLRHDGKKVGDPRIVSHSSTHAPADEAYYLDVIAIAQAGASGFPIKQ
jgi:hypothetical protein